MTRDTHVQIRLDVMTKERWQERAREEGLSLSAWIIRRCEKDSGPTRPDRADSLPGDGGKSIVSAPETVSFGSPGTGRKRAQGSAPKKSDCPYSSMHYPGFGKCK